MALMHSTITGPVESPLATALMAVPLTPAITPNSAASTTISPRRSVH
jgi:hypothetical protein